MAISTWLIFFVVVHFFSFFPSCTLFSYNNNLKQQLDCCCGWCWFFFSVRNIWNNIKEIWNKNNKFIIGYRIHSLNCVRACETEIEKKKKLKRHDDNGLRLQVKNSKCEPTRWPQFSQHITVYPIHALCI